MSLFDYLREAPRASDLSTLLLNALTQVDDPAWAPITRGLVNAWVGLMEHETGDRPEHDPFPLVEKLYYETFRRAMGLPLGDDGDGYGSFPECMDQGEWPVEVVVKAAHMHAAREMYRARAMREYVKQMGQQ